MCSLMAAFATSSWAACPEGDGWSANTKGECIFTIKSVKDTTINIPTNLEWFYLGYNGTDDGKIGKINIHCENNLNTVSIKPIAKDLNSESSFSIRNRINAVALGADASAASMLETYQSEIDMYTCTGSAICPGGTVTGLNALSIVFDAKTGENANQFGLIVSQEPYDFGPLQVYNVKGLDKTKIDKLLSTVDMLVANPWAASLAGLDAAALATIAEVQPLLGNVSALLARGLSNIALLEGDPKPENTYDLYGLSSSIAVDSVYFNRTFVNGTNNASTIALPFGIATDNIKGAYEILKFSRVADNTLYMKAAYCSNDNKNTYCPAKNEELKAYKPYLVRLDKATTLEFSGATTLVKTPAKTEFDVSNGNWAFRGVFEKKTWGSSTADPELAGCSGGCAYGYAASGENKGKFVRVGEGASIVPFRAYLVNTSASKLAPANASYVLRPTVNTPDELDIAVEGDNNQTTVIGKFNTRTGEMNFINNMKHTYDLKGRRVNGTNNARGAYYGKKVLMK